eukprot:6374740-Amphidinium_carterae.1
MYILEVVVSGLAQGIRSEHPRWEDLITSHASEGANVTVSTDTVAGCVELVQGSVRKVLGKEVPVALWLPLSPEVANFGPQIVAIVCFIWRYHPSQYRHLSSYDPLRNLGTPTAGEGMDKERASTLVWKPELPSTYKLSVPKLPNIRGSAQSLVRHVWAPTVVKGAVMLGARGQQLPPNFFYEQSTILAAATYIHSLVHAGSEVGSNSSCNFLDDKEAF